MTPPENDLRDAVARFLQEANPSWFWTTCLELADAMIAGPLAKARADLERVTADLTDYGSHIIDLEFKVFYAEAENTRLTALLAGAVEALKPFVKHYDPRWMDDWADHQESTSFSRVTFGDLRRARTTIAALDKAPTQKEPA